MTSPPEELYSDSSSLSPLLHGTACLSPGGGGIRFTSCPGMCKGRQHSPMGVATMARTEPTL